MNKLDFVAATVLLGSIRLAMGHPTAPATPAAPAATPAAAPTAATPAAALTTATPAAAPTTATPAAAPSAATPAAALMANPSSKAPEAKNQTDETAGKDVDLDTIATSPKDGSPYLGAKVAPVVVNIFSDFQCPVCKRSADPIKQLVVDYPGMVKVVFRNNALEMHKRARAAALAAMAAGKQGKFWQYHDRLFANQGRLDDASLRQTAQDLGLDLDQWGKDLADPKNHERVKEESAWATRLGAAGTPALFVNGIRQLGWGSYQGLKSMVAREVAKAKQLEAGGARRATIAAARIRDYAGKNVRKDTEAPPDLDQWVKVLTAD